jgi:predicted DNA-binding protein
MPTKRPKKARKPRIVPFPVRLPPDKRARLEGLAKADGRTLSNYILKVLNDHLKAVDPPQK